MMIREQGRKVQLIRTVYDPIKKRGVQKVIDTLPRYADGNPSAMLMEKLSADEQKQLTEWLDARRIENKQHADIFATAHAPSRLRAIADGISAACDVKNNPHADKFKSAREAMTDEWASACWDEINRLQKLLRKAGHPRPRAAKVDTAETETPSAPGA